MGYLILLKPRHLHIAITPNPAVAREARPFIPRHDAEYLLILPVKF
jgi:hypothetical protein